MAMDYIVKLVRFNDYPIGVTTLDMKSAELCVLMSFGFLRYDDYFRCYPAGSEYSVSRISTDRGSYTIADRYEANIKYTFISLFNVRGNAEMRRVISSLYNFKELDSWYLCGPIISETKLCMGFKTAKRKELYICSDWSDSNV